MPKVLLAILTAPPCIAPETLIKELPPNSTSSASIATRPPMKPFALISLLIVTDCACTFKSLPSSLGTPEKTTEPPTIEPIVPALTTEPSST